jgi:PTH2 family peptidyl-tRNA hydrolase
MLAGWICISTPAGEPVNLLSGKPETQAICERDQGMKQAIAARADIGMSAGKLAAQVAHGAVGAMLKSPTELQRRWLDAGQKKVVLRVPDAAAITQLAAAATDAGLAHRVIRDAGHTELAASTVTVIAVGPAEDAAIDAVTGDLPLW